MLPFTFGRESVCVGGGIGLADQFLIGEASSDDLIYNDQEAFEIVQFALIEPKVLLVPRSAGGGMARPKT
jgi:hypothetical protein